ncbi:MAG: hypothetical protein ABF608_06200 [Sporolactobacillus sp.]
MSFNHRLLIAFYSLFIAGFATVLIMALLFPISIGNSGDIGRVTFSLIISALLILVSFVSFYRWSARFNSSVQKWIAVTLFLMTGLFLIALAIYFHTIMPPLIDGGHTYVEALYLLHHHHASASSYFQIYPNNIPVTLLRYWLYRFFAVFHVHSYMLIDHFFCAGMLMASIYFSWLFTIRRFDWRMGNLFLITALTTLPLFFYTLYFYTDTVILMVPPLLALLWQSYCRTPRIRLLIVLGLSLGIGCQLRENLILFLPALIVYMMFTLRPKKWLLPLVICLTLLFTCQAVTQQISHFYGYRSNPRLSMPVTHWLMLGLSADGGYNKADYSRTLHQPTQSAKRAENWRIIKERLDHAHFINLFNLWGTKIARTWNMGAHGYYWYTEFTSHPNTTYAYLFGDRRTLVLFFIQAFYIVHLFLMLFSVLNFFRTKKLTINVLLQICLFGNLLFYTFIWEAEPRYSLLFSPYILLSSLFGLRELSQLITCELEKNGLIEKRQWLILTVISLLLLTGAINQHAVTEQRLARNYSVNLPHSLGKANAQITASHWIGQSFRITAPFNRIRFAIEKVRGNARYQADLEISGQRVQRSFFAASSTDQRQALEIRLPLQKRPYDAKAVLTLRQVSHSDTAMLALKMNSYGYDLRDMYRGGTLLQNGQPIAKSDLQFQVYRQHQAPLIPASIYQFLLYTLELLLLIAAVSFAIQAYERASFHLSDGRIRK